MISTVGKRDDLPGDKAVKNQKSRRKKYSCAGFRIGREMAR